MIYKCLICNHLLVGYWNLCTITRGNFPFPRRSWNPLRSSCWGSRGRCWMAWYSRWLHFPQLLCCVEGYISFVSGWMYSACDLSPHPVWQTCVEQRFNDPGEGGAVAKNSAFAEEFAFNIRTIFTNVESKIGQFLLCGLTRWQFSANLGVIYGCVCVGVVFRRTFGDRPEGQVRLRLWSLCAALSHLQECWQKVLQGAARHL